MALFQANVPPTYCFIRREFLYNLEEHFNEYEEVLIVGARLVRDLAVCFTVLTTRGAVFTNMPLHSLCSVKHRLHLRLDVLQLWNCLSNRFSLCVFNALSGSRVKVFLKDGTTSFGNYLYTFDWGLEDDVEFDKGAWLVPEQHKQGHLIELECGCFTLQPNNRLHWNVPHFVNDPFKPGERPDYITNTHTWSAEKTPANIKDSRFFYIIKKD